MPNQNNDATKEEKVYNLVVELEIAKKNKRGAVRLHNEEIKRIADEIDELLTENNALEEHE